MPADTGRSDLRTQEEERRPYAQGGTGLNQSRPRPFPCTRDHIEAQSGGKWANLGLEWGANKAQKPGEWADGWKAH